MFTGAKHGMGFLGWAASAVVTLAVAAGGSVVVPGLVNAEEPPPAVSSASVEAAAIVETPVGEVSVAPAPEVVVPEVTVPDVDVEVTTPPTTKAKAAPVTTVPAPVVTLPPVTLPPITVPALAARTVPSAAQVNAAIAGISSMVQLPFFVQISAANVAQVGDQVCTAFDQGQTFSQVKATGLSMVSNYGITVTPAAADYAVRTAVALYCPAYASKLV